MDQVLDSDSKGAWDLGAPTQKLFSSQKNESPFFSDLSLISLTGLVVVAVVVVV